MLPGYAAAVEHCHHHEVHTDTCGYAEAVSGSECTYFANGCPDCADQNGIASQSAEEEVTDPAEGNAESSTGPAEETTEPASKATEPSTEATESAPVCDCGTDDPAIHATTCPVYAAPENPECYCAEKCTEDNAVSAYDIHFRDADGNRINANGAKVSIAISGTELSVSSVTISGADQTLTSEVAGGEVSFTTDGSHYYVIAGKTVEDNPLDHKQQKCG